jgi:RNA polymerase primary sigma factor/RNA polymerase sigma factor
MQRESGEMGSKYQKRSKRGSTSQTAKRECRLVATRESIRAEDVERAKRLTHSKLSYIHSVEFEQVGAHRQIVGDGEFEVPLRAGRLKAPSDVPAQFAHLWEVALLKPEEERHLFRRMNFEKYCANSLRNDLTLERPNVGVMDRIERHLADARRIRDHIIQANLRLVVSIARRFVNDFTMSGELISDGNLSLMRAVERFDYSRGFRFSTYATHTVQRDFYRLYKNGRRRQAMEIVTDPEVLLGSLQASETTDQKIEDDQTVAWLKHLLAQSVSPREMCIVNMRYGLDSDDGGQTLREVGEKLEISKERVRQLQIRAINKVRQLALDEMPDLELPS